MRSYNVLIYKLCLLDFSKLAERSRVAHRSIRPTPFPFPFYVFFFSFFLLFSFFPLLSLPFSFIFLSPFLLVLFFFLPF